MRASVGQGNVDVEVDRAFDFSSCPYYPIRRRASRELAVVFGRALALRARALDLEWISTCLSQPAIYQALGMRHAPAERDVCRSQLPDGSGNMEAVEFLVLHDTNTTAVKGKLDSAWRNKLPQPTGFYLVYEARRARSQEVDFAFSPDYAAVGTSATVTLLRDGRIAILTYLIAACGVLRVQWVRRRQVPDSSRFRTSGPVRVENLDRFISLLERIETHSDSALPRVIEIVP